MPGTPEVRSVGVTRVQCAVMLMLGVPPVVCPNCMQTHLATSALEITTIIITLFFLLIIIIRMLIITINIIIKIAFIPNIWISIMTIIIVSAIILSIFHVYIYVYMYIYICIYVYIYSFTKA